MRIGHGYDAHKLVQGSGLTLGGIVIKCDYSLEAHSDGDSSAPAKRGASL
jgi:2C-methyl-D-erythritol 2,4-cyclodiphosphate synthase